jgi:hypothetical protein
VVPTPTFAEAAPTASLAERFVRTARSECLDWLLILNQQHLERVLEVFVTHYNEHRPPSRLVSRATRAKTFIGRVSD